MLSSKTKVQTLELFQSRNRASFIGRGFRSRKHSIHGIQEPLEQASLLGQTLCSRTAFRSRLWLCCGVMLARRGQGAMTGDNNGRSGGERTLQPRADRYSHLYSASSSSRHTLHTRHQTPILAHRRHETVDCLATAMRLKGGGSG